MITVRTATIDDLDGICRIADEINTLHHEHAPQDFLPANDVTRDRDMWQQAIEAEDGVLFVALRDNAVIGFVSAILITNHHISFLVPKRICRINSVVVSATERRSGVATQLFAWVESWAKSESADQLALNVANWNAGAITFYEQNGFVDISRTMVRRLK
ncbi:MAG: GNAT family N-acetyltransferase [Gammaproteobacteria bacterium]|nr:GNAT family N-acetyltransferase [Gammaproteobacteria bacterium]